MNIIKYFICENYLWFASTLILLFIGFIWVLVIANKKKRRFLVWKKETVNLWIYSSEKEYGKDDIMQELYDENIKFEKQNKILKKQISDSGFMAIIFMFTMLIILWIKRNKKDSEKSDNNPTAVSNDMIIEAEDSTPSTISLPPKSQ